MTDASTSGNMSPELMKVVERAQREPEGRFHSLAHLIDVPALERAYQRIRKDGAVGVDGVTKEQYGQKLQGNLENLHERLKAKRYRHQPIRRVHIPKDKGKTRPIGISAFEDRVVQDAVREVLQAIYEQDFLDCSYGFRPGRSAHDALRAGHRGQVDLISVIGHPGTRCGDARMALEATTGCGSVVSIMGRCEAEPMRRHPTVQAVALLMAAWGAALGCSSSNRADGGAADGRPEGGGSADRGFPGGGSADGGAADDAPADDRAVDSGEGEAGGATSTDSQSEAGGETPAQRPNVIIVLTDDQGYADVGCFGAQGFATPSLDRLAAEGIQLTDFYSAGNVCSPSRAALMTGCYPIRVGVTDVYFPGSNIGLSLPEVTIAELLKSRGYATAAIGKWHLGDDPAFLPTRQGFDEYFGLPYSNDMYPLPLLDGETAIEWSPDLSQLTKRYTEKARDFITRNRQGPFFLYLAHTMPHVPLAASADFEGLSARGLYGDVLMEIDWSVGRLLDTLDELGLAGNTLVAFTSDNGPWLSFGDYGGSAGPLREGKGTTFDGGHRVPCIMRWPDRIKGRTVSKEVASMMDLFPTIAEITGAALPPWTIDGKSILPILEGRPGARSPHDVVYFYEYADLQAMRSGPWKLHLPHSYVTITEPGKDGTYGQEEWRDLELSLFDLRADPGESVNLAEQYPYLAGLLANAAAAFDADVKQNQRPAGGR